MLGSIDAYQTKWQKFNIGAVGINLLTLKNFEEAVDQVVDELQKRGAKDLDTTVCPYFGQIWASAIALSEWVEANGGNIKGQSTLEIGCGLALPSLVAAKIGAIAHCFDLHDDVGHFMTANLEENNLSGKVFYQTEDWQKISNSPKKYASIFGSDILYEKHHAPSLAKYLKSALERNGTAVFTDPCRWHHLEFVEELKNCGFSVEYKYHWTLEEGRDLKICTILARH